MNKLLKILLWILISPIIALLAGFALLIILSTFCMVYLILLSFINNGEVEREYSYQFEIQALRDNHNHIISRYSVENKHNYYFIRKLDGGLKSGSVNSNDSIIIEDDNENPRIEVYREYPKYGKWVTKNILENEIFISHSAISKYYKIYIPKNSITEEFNVDLK